MYRQWIKWIIVGFAAVPPHAAFADEAVGLGSVEVGSATSETVGDMGVLLPPNAILVLSVSASALLTTGAAIYSYNGGDMKRLFREARDQAVRSAAVGDQTPIASLGRESSLARAIEIEKQAAIRENVTLPQLTELQWAAVVAKHATQVEAL